MLAKQTPLVKEATASLIDEGTVKKKPSKEKRLVARKCSC